TFLNGDIKGWISQQYATHDASSITLYITIEYQVILSLALEYNCCNSLNTDPILYLTMCDTIPEMEVEIKQSIFWAEKNKERMFSLWYDYTIYLFTPMTTQRCVRSVNVAVGFLQYSML
ncbi:unnamed protein product, partial [Owenia fusiformis]